MLEFRLSEVGTRGLMEKMRTNENLGIFHQEFWMVRHTQSQARCL